MYTYFNFNLYFRRCRFSFCIAIVFLFVYLSCFQVMIFGKDFPIKAVDKNNQPVNKKISLEEALKIAIEKNPQLQSTRDQIDVAVGSLRQSKIYPNPVLGLLAEEVPSNEVGLNQSQNLVSITQPIVTAGKRGLGIKLGEKSKEKNEFEHDVILLNVMADTKKAFYKSVADQEGLV